MSKISKEVKKYFKEVKKNLSCSLVNKKAYIDFIINNIDFEVLSDKNTTYNDLVQMLGAPVDVASNFNSTNKTEIELRSKIFSNTILINILLIFVVILLILTIITLLDNLGGYIIISD